LPTAPRTASPLIKTLSAIIRNVQKKPDEEKYRKLRAGNAAFKRKFGGLPGFDRVLFAVGFKATMRDGGASAQQPRNPLAARSKSSTRQLAR
jgi:hypothetical protein